jgi:ParB-like chromosome segregation protein Spo0J
MKTLKLKNANLSLFQLPSLREVLQPEHVAGLKESIYSTGIVSEPLKIDSPWDGTNSVSVLDGQHRLAALRILQEDLHDLRSTEEIVLGSHLEPERNLDAVKKLLSKLDTGIKDSLFGFEIVPFLVSKNEIESVSKEFKRAQENEEEINAYISSLRARYEAQLSLARTHELPDFSFTSFLKKIDKQEEYRLKSEQLSSLKEEKCRLNQQLYDFNNTWKRSLKQLKERTRSIIEKLESIEFSLVYDKRLLDDDLKSTLRASALRKDQSYLDKIATVRELLDRGKKEKEIVALTGDSVRTVQRLMGLSRHFPLERILLLRQEIENAFLDESLTTKKKSALLDAISSRKGLKAFSRIKESGGLSEIIAHSSFVDYTDSTEKTKELVGAGGRRDSRARSKGSDSEMISLSRESISALLNRPNLTKRDLVSFLDTLLHRE